jgi:hypothetical protein
MHTEWLAQEHYRIHLMEEWPDGARKEAGLAAAKSALYSLQRTAPPQASAFMCEVCAARHEMDSVTLAVAA